MYICRYWKAFETLPNFSTARMIKTKHMSKASLIHPMPLLLWGISLRRPLSPSARVCRYYTQISFNSPCSGTFQYTEHHLSPPFQWCTPPHYFVLSKQSILKKPPDPYLLRKVLISGGRTHCSLCFYISTSHVILFYYWELFANLILFNGKILKQW